MVDETLEKARMALEEWKKTITVEKFIEDHKRLSIVDKIKNCSDFGEECVFTIGLIDFVICPKCGRYKKHE